jgi:LmbE family N-acetylglucosaminyl deacetylase
MLDLLVISAHPDDEILIAGPLIATTSARGGSSLILCATNGDAGTGNALDLALPDDIVTVRSRELRCAAEALGASSVQFLGFIDGGSSGEAIGAPKLTDNIDEASARIEDLILSSAPRVVVTHSQDDPDCHPDHLAISQATARAVERVSKRLPNQPAFYFSAFPDAARRHIVSQGGSLSQAEVADRLAPSLSAPTGCDLEIAITPEIRLQLLRSISCHGSQARSLAPLRSLLLSGQDRLALGFNLAPLSS